MRVWLTLSFLYFFWGYAVAAQSMTYALVELVSDTGAQTVCALNTDAATRSQRNALLIVPAVGSEVSALVFRRDLTRTAPETPPCWAGPGHCAVFEGDLTLLPPSACTSGDGFQQMWVSGVHSIRDPANTDPTLLTLGDQLMVLADGMRPEDTHVAFHEDTPVFMSTGPSGARRVRMELPSGMLRIDRLRIALGSVNKTLLFDGLAALGTEHFALVGTRGLVSADGRLFLDGNCYRLVAPDIVRHRLETANEVFGLESPPAPGDATISAFDDLAQALIGGTVVNGRSLDFFIDQDPLLFLLEVGQAGVCP